jgi:hypothetical protein
MQCMYLVAYSVFILLINQRLAVLYKSPKYVSVTSLPLGLLFSFGVFVHDIIVCFLHCVHTKLFIYNGYIIEYLTSEYP